MAINYEVIESRLFASQVAEEILASIDDCLSQQASCSLVLAGGSTPSSIYRLLSRPPKINEVRWSKLKLFWGDERFVPHDHENSNYRMLRETLLQHLGASTPEIYPVDTSLGSVEASAKAYDATIRKAMGVQTGNNNWPHFDLVLLGLGEDGHTASIFPGSSEASANDNTNSEIALVAKNPNDGSMRVTLSCKALLSAKKILFIVSGANKAEIIKRVFLGTEDSAIIPARLFVDPKVKTAPKITWLIDSAAGALL